MARRDIVVIGASAGGLEALKILIAGLPANFPAAIFVAMHVSPDGPGLMAEILDRAGALPASHAIDGEGFQHGRIYVAPPDRHLMVEPDRIRLTYGPKENRFRPAVDVLFRSAAYGFGPRVIGVVLSGLLDDGTAGLWAIKDRGGIAVVQDPNEALYPSMPNHALQQVAVDYAVGMAEMSGLLVRLTDEPVAIQEDAPMGKSLEIENRIAMADNALEAGVLSLGPISPYTCPECHGALVQLKERGPTRFRCHTGHAFSLDGLLAATNESIDETLWSAVRVLDERMLLLQQMEEYAREAGDDQTAARVTQKIRATRQRLQRLRQLALDPESTSPENLGDDRAAA